MTDQFKKFDWIQIISKVSGNVTFSQGSPSGEGNNMNQEKVDHLKAKKLEILQDTTIPEVLRQRLAGCIEVEIQQEFEDRVGYELPEHENWD